MNDQLRRTPGWRGAAVRVAAVGALVLSASGVGRATVLLPADLADLVREAQVVVHARVVDVRAVWAGDRRRIDTLVTLEALEYYKGEFGPSVTVRVPGGQIGAYRSVTVGAPSFAVADDVVLFLGARGPSIPHVLGLSQGVFRVVNPDASATPMVVPPPLVATAASAGPIRRGSATRRPMPLSDFGDEIRRLAGDAGGAR